MTTEVSVTTLKKLAKEKYDDLVWVYQHATEVDTGYSKPFIFDTDERKLMVAHAVYMNGITKRYGTWGLNWDYFNLKGVNGGDVWKALQQSVDGIPCKNIRKLQRKRSFAPAPELFDTPETLWFNSALSVPENIDAIFKEHGKIVHYNSLESITVEKAGGKTRSVEALIKASQDQALTLDEAIRMQQYYTRVIGNKSKCKSVITMQVPTELQDVAKHLVKAKLYCNTRKPSAKQLAELSIIGYVSGIVDYDFINHDDVEYYLVEQHPFEDVIKSIAEEQYLINETDNIGFALDTKGIGFARCVNIRTNNLTALDVNIDYTCIAPKNSQDDISHSGIEFSKYIIMLKEQFKSNREEVVNLISDLKSYHVCRKNINQPWEFNFSAMSLELYAKGIFVSADVFRWLSTRDKWNMTFELAQELGNAV